MFNGDTLLYIIWVFTISSVILFIPKNRIHMAWQAFLFGQVLTWPLGLFIADLGWVQYPVNFFENATQASFTYEYLFLPVICAYFVVYFPSKRRLSTRLAYYAGFCTVLTLLELIILHYTNLIRYIHWNAFFTWITIWTILYTTRKFCVWFFRSYNAIS